jgi:hypothetical protein
MPPSNSAASPRWRALASTSAANARSVSAAWLAARGASSAVAAVHARLRVLRRERETLRGAEPIDLVCQPAGHVGREQRRHGVAELELLAR